MKQFTLVYSDWRVLRTDNQKKNKGVPCMDKGLFGDLLGEQGIRIDKIFKTSRSEDAQHNNTIAYQWHHIPKFSRWF